MRRVADGQRELQELAHGGEENGRDAWKGVRYQ